MNRTALKVSRRRHLPFAGLLLGILAVVGIGVGLAFAEASVSATHIAKSAGAANAPALTATPTPCISGWTLVPSPNVGSSHNILKGVAAISSDDVRAAGYYYSATVGGFQTLIEQWDGTSWSVAPSANQSSDNVLTGIAAVSANDVWAVGYYGDNGNQTMAEHWNGSAWSIVASPNRPATNNYLSAIAAAASNDVWAVGYSGNIPGLSDTLTEHWDGTAWTIVSSPDGSGLTNALYGVTAVSANDAWAVGFTTIDDAVTLIEHWDGTAWTVVASTSPGTGNYLNGVAAVSANNVWAVGYYNNNNTSAWDTLVEHWNGSSWSTVSSANQSGNSYLRGVTTESTNDVWAVGYYNNSGPDQTLVEHSDGITWSVVPSPNQPSTYNYLNAIAAVSSNNVWAVGNYHVFNGIDQTLIEHYTDCGTMSTATPAPTTSTPTVTQTPTPTYTSTSSRTVTPTSLSATPTLTALLTATPTAMSSPTSCPITFSDVPPGSTFYSYIRCLACRGIINGYADGTFKPNNQVTRGQLSKIVSNSAGFSDPQTTQIFQDVPVGSTFQVYIGRLASRGYINGYACGGAGEPCVPPANLPYFRPNANATRGQISKIDANAAGFGDAPSGQQFEDVAVGGTYYTYTYRLVSRSVMAGYACGAVGEPCVPPANLPYFRPSNNATRGQTSKIVANTFFPDCQTPEKR